MLKYNQFIKESVSDITTEEDVLIVKDVFQDIIDEYDLYPGKIGYYSGVFYGIYLDSDTNSVVFLVWSESNNWYQQSDVLSMDLTGHIKTIESMGYGVENRSTVWGGGIDNRFSILSGKMPRPDEIMVIELRINRK